jgi:hypothetical protein
LVDSPVTYGLIIASVVLTWALFVKGGTKGFFAAFALIFLTYWLIKLFT